MRRFFLQIIALIAVLGCIFASQTAGQAQTGTAYDIIDAVNSIRTSYGHPALEVDPILMATAQATADIMASTGSCAHIGNVSGRVAAAGYGGGAQVWATENIACGNDLSVQTTVYQYWADASHMLPMTNGNYVHVGAGVTVVDGRVYYVLHAAYTSGSSSSASTPGSSVQKTSGPNAWATSQFIQPVVTSTPNPDGSVVHEVKSGQALWSIAIAYGVKIADLISLNKLPANPILTIGQKLLVYPSATPTLSPTATRTTIAPTRTPTRTPTPKTPSPTPSLTPSQTHTPAPLIHWKAPAWLDNHAAGIGLVVVSAAGLVALALTSLRKK
jgi:LysM repeat protein